MDIELVAAIAGLLISALFSFVPKFDVWYAALEGAYKRLIMLVVLLGSVLAIWGAGCIGLWGTCLPWRDVLRAFLVALAANQSTYLITPKTNRVREADTAAWVVRNTEAWEALEEDEDEPQDSPQ